MDSRYVIPAEGTGITSNAEVLEVDLNGVMIELSNMLLLLFTLLSSPSIVNEIKIQLKSN